MELVKYFCKDCKWVFDLDMRFRDNPGTVTKPIYCPRCGRIWKSEKTPTEIVEHIGKFLTELKDMVEK